MTYAGGRMGTPMPGADGNPGNPRPERLMTYTGGRTVTPGNPRPGAR